MQEYDEFLEANGITKKSLNGRAAAKTHVLQLLKMVPT